MHTNLMFTKHEKLLLFILACIQFCHIVDFMIMMPLGPQLSRVFNLDPHQFGILVSSYTFSAGISGFISAFFIDRFDRKKSLLFYYAGFTVGTVACGLSTSYYLLLSSRALTGLFGGVLGSLVLSIVSDQVDFSRRGTAMGIVMGAFSVASVLGVPFSIFLANHFDWHAPFLFLGGVAFLIWLASSKMIQPMKNHLKGPHERQSFTEVITHILNTPAQMIALVFMFCLVMGQFTVIPYLSQSYVTNAGMKESELPFIYLTGGVVSFFTSPIIGKLSDKYGKKIIFYYSVLLSCIPLLIITNMTVQPMWILLATSCFFFICMGGRMVPAITLVSEAATPKYRGSFMSISNSIQQISASIASFVAGIIVVKGSNGELLNYPLVGYIAVFFSIAAFLMATRLRAPN